MKELFLILRILAFALAASGLGVLAILVFLQSAAEFAKESVSAVASVATLVASGFQNNRPVRQAAGWVFSAQQAGVGCVFVMMIVSVFYPSTKILLHGIALAALLFGAWFVWTFIINSSIEVVFVPFLGLWMIYYTACLYWGKELGNW